MRLQSKSPPTVIHMEDSQGPFQPMHHHSLFFTRTLLASYSKNDRTIALLSLISPLRSHQKNSLQKSHNLGFDFILQYIEKSNPRISTPHLLFFSPLFFLYFSLFFFFIFFSNFFSHFFLYYHMPRSLISHQNSALIP